MTKGLVLEDLFPGRFLRSVEFKGKAVTLTITGVELEDLPDEKGGERTRGIVSFLETKKMWVLNRTNAEALKAMFGSKCDDWASRQVTLYPERVRFGKETVDGIRVKGSPEMTKPITFEFRLPRKKPIQVTLEPTAKRATKTELAAEAAP